MMLVFFICLFLVIFALAIILSTIRIRVEKLEVSNINNENKLKYDYEVYLELYFLDKLKMISIKINKEKLNKLGIKEKMKSLDFRKVKSEIPKKEEVKEIIKKLKINLSRLNLKIEIGTIDVIITSGLVAIIGSILGFILAKTIKRYKKERYNYEIYPIYQNKNLIKLILNCIIKVKMVHIIFIIYLLLKKRRVENSERTSNRRAYDYSYE